MTTPDPGLLDEAAETTTHTEPWPPLPTDPRLAAEAVRARVHAIGLYAGEAMQAAPPGPAQDIAGNLLALIQQVEVLAAAVQGLATGSE